MTYDDFIVNLRHSLTRWRRNFENRSAISEVTRQSSGSF